MTTTPTPPPWKKKNPVRPAARTRLTGAQKEQARERAEAAGRRYPNLVDNMWAAAQAKLATARDADEDDDEDR